MSILKKPASITPSPLSSTVILFLLAAPIVVLLYASFVFNPFNADNLILYVIQVIADSISIIVLMSLWLTILMDVLVAHHHRIHKPMQPEALFLHEPTIDVMITVAGEPIEILRETFDGVSKMDHPHKTFVLDDGKSAEVAALAREHGFYYVNRDTKNFAKAGNLNHGLRYSTGEFFAIFDADQVPQPDFLTTLLPYMLDPKIGMVQSPQHFTNTQYFIASGTAQAQEIFYSHICPAKNISNSAFCVGTNVLFRRAAVDGIGGIAQVGHSEDIWTSFLLHEAGWKTIFVNKILASGKAPITISAFFKQQLRWSKGGLSMLLLHNPLFSESLTIDQKLQYFSSNFFYLVGFSIFAYLLFPLLYLLFDVKSLHTESGIIWLLHYLPYFFLYYSLTWLLLGKIKISTLATALGSFYPYILAFISVIFGTKIKWTATTSAKSKSMVLIQWIWPHVFLIILTLFAFVIGWYKPVNFWTTVYNTIWAGVNLYLLFVFITAEKRKAI